MRTGAHAQCRGTAAVTNCLAGPVAGNLEAVRLLLKQEGRLQMRFLNGSKSVAKAAWLDAEDLGGASALGLAERHHFTGIASLLRAAGAREAQELQERVCLSVKTKRGPFLPSGGWSAEIEAARGEAEGAGDACEIDEVDGMLDAGAFFEGYYSRSRPVIMRGAAAGWPQRAQWAKVQLVAKAGGLHVPVSRIPYGGAFGLPEEEVTLRNCKSLHPLDLLRSHHHIINNHQSPLITLILSFSRTRSYPINPIYVIERNTRT